MLPTWMIEELEKRRREQEPTRRPGLHVDVPVRLPTPPQAEEAEPRSTVVVIEIL